MEYPLALARIVLGVVFVVAAVLKLRDRIGAVDGARSLGVPASLAPAVAAVLPVAEIAVTVLLLAVPILGAIAALALLVIFSAAIAAQLAQGKRPVCHCFGALSARPAGVPELVRNAALLVLAAVVILGT